MYVTNDNTDQLLCGNNGSMCSFSRLFTILPLLIINTSYYTSKALVLCEMDQASEKSIPVFLIFVIVE